MGITNPNKELCWELVEISGKLKRCNTQQSKSKPNNPSCSHRPCTILEDLIETQTLDARDKVRIQTALART